MSHMHEFIDMFEPAPPEFRISIGHENHTNPNAQEQQRQGSQLFHKLHSESPSNRKVRATTLARKIFISCNSADSFSKAGHSIFELERANFHFVHALSRGLE
jgi:hypothetical protein